MIDRLIRQDCVVTPRSQTGAEDEYQAPTWVDGTPVADLFHYEPIKSEELVNRPGFIATYRGWFRSTSTLGVHYKVTTTGHSFEIDGNPRNWINPRNNQSYFEVDFAEIE